jgi:hypothetical protein
MRSAVDVVTLHPPNAWHLDFIGDEDDETGDYALSSLGPRKTKLNMTFTAHYKIVNAPSKAQDAKQTREVWNKYAAALERDYSTPVPRINKSSGIPASNRKVQL